ncbi:hypothetical protein PFDG_00422 [Plasmodium falciparum Dd2]|uniref:GYF domain-containing protein n=1 Tax=Plasmodium falciparum (isolate Dd2) TaxID=57267 RepID=A0A0L7LWW1_PLAF4|nr:hypothetical protein PFDG_00422 [Plasmodium falciparum Dd2]
MDINLYIHSIEIEFITNNKRIYNNEEEDNEDDNIVYCLNIKVEDHLEDNNSKENFYETPWYMCVKMGDKEVCMMSYEMNITHIFNLLENNEILTLYILRKNLKNDKIEVLHRNELHIKDKKYYDSENSISFDNDNIKGKIKLYLKNAIVYNHLLKKIQSEEFLKNDFSWKSEINNIKNMNKQILFDDIKISDDIKTSDDIKISDNIKISDDIKTSDDIKISDDIKTSDEIKTSDNIKSNDPIQSSDHIQSNDHIKSNDPIQSSDHIQSNDHIKSNDPIQSSDHIQSNDHIKSNDNNLLSQNKYISTILDNLLNTKRTLYWVYIDDDNKEQGPFNSYTIFNWVSNEYFEDNTLIRLHDQKEYFKLYQVIEYIEKNVLLYGEYDALFNETEKECENNYFLNNNKNDDGMNNICKRDVLQEINKISNVQNININELKDTTNWKHIIYNEKETKGIENNLKDENKTKNIYIHNIKDDQNNNIYYEPIILNKDHIIENKLIEKEKKYLTFNNSHFNKIEKNGKQKNEVKMLKKEIKKIKKEMIKLKETYNKDIYNTTYDSMDKVLYSDNISKEQNNLENTNDDIKSNQYKNNVTDNKNNACTNLKDMDTMKGKTNKNNIDNIKLNSDIMEKDEDVNCKTDDQYAREKNEENTKNLLIQNDTEKMLTDTSLKDSTKLLSNVMRNDKEKNIHILSDVTYEEDNKKKKFIETAMSSINEAQKCILKIRKKKMTTFLNKIMSTPIHTKTTHWSYENLQLHGKKYSSFNLKNDEKKNIIYKNENSFDRSEANISYIHDKIKTSTTKNNSNNYHSNCSYYDFHSSLEISEEEKIERNQKIEDNKWDIIYQDLPNKTTNNIQIYIQDKTHTKKQRIKVHINNLVNNTKIIYIYNTTLEWFLKCIALIQHNIRKWLVKRKILRIHNIKKKNKIKNKSYTISSGHSSSNNNYNTNDLPNDNNIKDNYIKYNPSSAENYEKTDFELEDNKLYYEQEEQKKIKESVNKIKKLLSMQNKLKHNGNYNNFSNTNNNYIYNSNMFPREQQQNYKNGIKNKNNGIHNFVSPCNNKLKTFNNDLNMEVETKKNEKREDLNVEYKENNIYEYNEEKEYEKKEKEKQEKDDKKNKIYEQLFKMRYINTYQDQNGTIPIKRHNIATADKNKLLNNNNNNNNTIKRGDQLYLKKKQNLNIMHDRLNEIFNRYENQNYGPYDMRTNKNNGDSNNNNNNNNNNNDNIITDHNNYDYPHKKEETIKNDNQYSNKTNNIQKEDFSFNRKDILLNIVNNFKFDNILIEKKKNCKLQINTEKNSIYSVQEFLNKIKEKAPKKTSINNEDITKNVNNNKFNIIKLNDYDNSKITHLRNIEKSPCDTNVHRMLSNKNFMKSKDF